MEPELDLARIETKLAAARARLILDKPFLGALVLRLPLQRAGNWCKTTATDARGFYYNAEYIQALSLPETQFVLAHEALHCALSHFARRNHRDKRRWDLACDFAINPLLIEEGLKPPPNAVAIASYLGMTAEEIYPLIEEDDQRETMDQHEYDQNHDGGGSGSDSLTEKEVQSRGESGHQPEQDEQRQGGNQAQPRSHDEGGAQRPDPLSEDEKSNLRVQWQQRMAGAAQQAMQAGKMSGTLGRLVDHLLQPQLPWQNLLARYLTATARNDYQYSRPSKREGEFILPSLRSHEVDLLVAVDTSGSIKEHEISAFISEVNALKGQANARVTLLPCDAELAHGAPWRFEPWETFSWPETIKGGGGTSFVPVFDWADRQDTPPNLLVYFTDAEGEFPAREPSYPVLWLVKGRLPVPWGQRIQLN